MKWFLFHIIHHQGPYTVNKILFWVYHVWSLHGILFLPKSKQSKDYVWLQVYISSDRFYLCYMRVKMFVKTVRFSESSSTISSVQWLQIRPWWIKPHLQTTQKVIVYIVPTSFSFSRNIKYLFTFKNKKDISTILYTKFLLRSKEGSKHHFITKSFVRNNIIQHSSILQIWPASNHYRHFLNLFLYSLYHLFCAEQFFRAVLKKFYYWTNACVWFFLFLMKLITEYWPNLQFKHPAEDNTSEIILAVDLYE